MNSVFKKPSGVPNPIQTTSEAVCFKLALLLYYQKGVIFSA